MERYLDKVICADCGELVTYKIRTKETTREINGKKYIFKKCEAICGCCGNIVTVPGLDDENERAFERCFRESNDYVQVEEINQILEKYDIEKRPLSKVLGMGEHTIERYLEGQLPNRKYSIELKRVLNDSSRMQEYFERFHELLTPKAAEKLNSKLSYYKEINSSETFLEKVALYILNSKYEITNLSLQKLLYYVEGLSEVFLKKSVFEQPCQAWKYGPVYKMVYDKYKSFGRNPIVVDKKDFSGMLDEDTIKVINYVLDHFAIYNGTTLMEFTHREEPWARTHAEYDENDLCAEEIPHELIKKYFIDTDEKYHLKEEKGIEEYIEHLFAL